MTNVIQFPIRETVPQGPAGPLDRRNSWWVENCGDFGRDPDGNKLPIVVANPGYWPKGQLGVTYLDTSTGITWAYKHGWYSGQWMFHGVADEPNGFYGTSDNYVPQRVRDAAAPIIATYPPFNPMAYDEDYV